jgi:hypothetical protein
MVVALLGVFIGWGLGFILFRQPSFRGQFCWGASFFFFGVMNAGGIGYHCLPGRHLAFYVLDVVGTSCSSLSIIFGCLACKGIIDDCSLWTKWILFYSYLGILTAVTAAKGLGVSIVCELLYLVPMELAGIAVLWLLCCRTPPDEMQRGQVAVDTWRAEVAQEKESCGKSLRDETFVRGDNSSEVRDRKVWTEPSRLKHRSKPEQVLHQKRFMASVGSEGRKRVYVDLAANKVWLFWAVASTIVGGVSVSLDRVICRFQRLNWLAVVWIFVACDLAFLFFFAFLRTYR